MTEEQFNNLSEIDKKRWTDATPLERELFEPTVQVGLSAWIPLGSSSYTFWNISRNIGGEDDK